MKQKKHEVEMFYQCRHSDMKLFIQPVYTRKAKIAQMRRLHLHNTHYVVYMSSLAVTLFFYQIRIKSYATMG